MQPHHLIMDETGVILLSKHNAPAQAGSICATVPAISSSYSAVPAEAPPLLPDSIIDQSQWPNAPAMDDSAMQSAPDYIDFPGGKRAYAAFVIMGFALLVPWSAV
jgi:hypothetical protein